jgi:photosystem II stability/assembly factor-like uncharacterized protein
MRTKHTLILTIALMLSFAASAQWVKQTLPQTIGVPALEYPGKSKASVGKNTLWMFSRNVNGDSTKFGAVEAVRTFDAGRTYRVSTLPVTNIGYHYAPHLVNAGTAYVASTSYETGATAIHRSVDSGTTWQMLPYHPEGFLNAAIFYDANIGIAILDPDTLGAYFAYSINGGTTFTRLPQTNLPRLRPHEVFYGGGHQIVGDVIFQPSYDIETFDSRVWRSVDRGRNWTAGEWVEELSPFGTSILFTDKDNGLWLSGNVTPNPHAFYTTDGGETWKPSGNLPGVPSGGVLNALPNTSNIINIFADEPRKMLFSAATNDYGKTWHSKKDLAAYRPDSIYLSFGIPPFAWTNLDIVDNNTAWAKLSRTDLFRYDNATPLIPEKPDLDLTLTADTEGLPLWGYVKFTLTMRNRGISRATDVKANWLPPYKRTDNGGEAFANVGAYASKGNYNWWTGDWTLSELAAGESATATFHLFVVNNTANVAQTAQITACNELDLDSSPNNMAASPKEDDEVSFVSKATVRAAPDAPTAFKSSIGVYPNPTTDKINVIYKMREISDLTLSLTDANGRLVMKKMTPSVKTGAETLSLLDLAKGVYFLKLTNAAGEVQVQKVVKQ